MYKMHHKILKCGVFFAFNKKYILKQQKYTKYMEKILNRPYNIFKVF